MISVRKAKEILGNELKLETFIFPEFFHEKMMFLPQYSKYLPSSFKYDYCYVIVHPGYSSSWVEGTFKYAISRDGSDYPSYYSKIKDLIKYLRASDELSIFFIGYKENFSFPQSSLFVFTKVTKPDPLDKVGTGSSKKKIKWNMIYPFLKEIGVKEVRIAGEWVWWNVGMGCVGIVAKKFAKSFDVKGIEGCLYPPYPPSEIPELARRRVGKGRIEEIVWKLYEKQIKIV